MLLALYLIPAVLTALYLIYDDWRAGYITPTIISFAAYLAVGLAWPVFISVNLYLGLRYLWTLK